MVSLHFRNADAVEFQVEQTVTGLRAGNYRLSIQAQGGGWGTLDDFLLNPIEE